MVKSLCIKTNNNKILDYLLNSLEDIDNIRFSKNKFKIYNNVIIHYLGNDINDFYDKLSDIIYNLIIIFYEKKLLSRLVNSNYFYFLDFEKKQIVDSCLDIINSDEFNDDSNQNIKDSRKIAIKKCVYEYFRQNKQMILDGFINFRLRSYLEILDYSTDIGVNRFIIEREYIEFIKLLKLYIETNSSNIDMVHLIYSNKTSFLTDENKNLIKVDDDIFNVKYLSDISFSSNDYTLNALLTLLPHKIYIHLIDEEDEFINTLKLIFDKRIVICTNCDICNFYSQKLYKLKMK